MVKFFKFVALAAVTILVAVWMRGFLLDSRPNNTDLRNEDDAIAHVENDPAPTDDREKYEWVLEERDLTTGSKVYLINGSPVQGKLKAYLQDQATREERDLIYAKTHPDAEPTTWVLIPKPLFLSLTDQSPSR